MTGPRPAPVQPGKSAGTGSARRRLRCSVSQCPTNRRIPRIRELARSPAQDGVVSASPGTNAAMAQAEPLPGPPSGSPAAIHSGNPLPEGPLAGRYAAAATMVVLFLVPYLG